MSLRVVHIISVKPLVALLQYINVHRNRSVLTLTTFVMRKDYIYKTNTTYEQAGRQVGWLAEYIYIYIYICR